MERGVGPIRSSGRDTEGKSRLRKAALRVAVTSALAGAGVLVPMLTQVASATPAPGTMYIADQSCACVWEVTPGGGGPYVYEGVDESPQDVAIDSSGDLFWTQADNGEIEELTSGGDVETLASGLDVPWGITVDSSGDVFFGAFGGPSGGPAGLYELVGGSGTPTLITSDYGVFTSLAVDGNGDVYGADSAEQLVVIPPGSQGTVVDVPGVSEVNGVRLDGSDDIYASTAFGDDAIELPAGSNSVTTFGTGLNYTEGVAVDGAGDVFVGQPASVSGYGKVYEVSGGNTTLYTQGDLADTGGLVLYPPVVPAARSTATATISSPSPSSVNSEQVVTLNVSVSGSPTGYVEFDDNGSSLGTVALSGGSASLTTTLPAGTADVDAIFEGNSSDAPALSNALAFTVTPIASKTVVSAPDGTSVPGDGEATVEATVTGKGGTPTGYVEFFANGDLETEAELAGGQATANFPLSPGSSKVTAQYEGDSVFATSTSKALKFTTVPPYNPTMTAKVKYSKDNPEKEKTATITVKVTGVKGNGAPTGTVGADDGFTCGSLSVVSSTVSTASCSALLPNETDEYVDLTYSGDSNYNSDETEIYVQNGGGGGD
ncbi:MAG: Ig-like domain repeat protein [Acidimicrobiales bacterium]|jgi:hypothetical protein